MPVIAVIFRVVTSRALWANVGKIIGFLVLAPLSLTILSKELAESIMSLWPLLVFAGLVMITIAFIKAYFSVKEEQVISNSNSNNENKGRKDA